MLAAAVLLLASGADPKSAQAMGDTLGSRGELQFKMVVNNTRYMQREYRQRRRSGKSCDKQWTGWSAAR